MRKLIRGGDTKSVKPEHLVASAAGTVTVMACVARRLLHAATGRSACLRFEVSVQLFLPRRSAVRVRRSVASKHLFCRPKNVLALPLASLFKLTAVNAHVLARSALANFGSLLRARPGGSSAYSSFQ